MHHHISCKWHGKIISKSFFRNFGGSLGRVPFCQVGGVDVGEEVPRIQYSEEQFIAFFTIFSQQRRQVFHGRRFNRSEAVKAIYFFDSVENIIAFCHFFGRKVACSFRNGWFLHFSLFFCSAKINNFDDIFFLLCGVRNSRGKGRYEKALPEKVLRKAPEKVMA